MFSKHRPAWIVMAGFTAAAGGRFSMGQCEPDWVTTIGNPGITSGYVAPMLAWDDGGGERLFVGGSFTAVAGNTSRRMLAKWNPDTGGWATVGTGLSAGSTNGFLTSMALFDPDGEGERLVVGGWFASAGGAANSACLAMWNGTSWANLGTGWTPTNRGAIWALKSWGGRLYAGGGLFPAGATLPVGALASWDGQGWQMHVTDLTSASNNPGIFSLETHDDGTGERLYAAGRFDAIDGVFASGVARLEDATWSPVGQAFTSTGAFAAVKALTVFDDGAGAKLYAGSYSYRLPGQPSPGGFIAAQVIRWDGADWSQVGDWLGTGIVEDIEVFDDGGGAALYAGGQALPDVQYLNKFESGAWQVVGGGFTAVQPPWPGVFGLSAWGDSLYVGGTFTDLEGPAANSIVAWRGCPDCLGDLDGDGERDLGDLATLLTNFGRTNAPPSDGDLDGDGDVDLGDLARMLTVFGSPC